MGGRSSRKLFTEWDLIQFSNITGVPLSIVEKIYKHFITVTGDDNKMDKREFRRLYKEMYISSHISSMPSAMPFFTEHDLHKMSDHIFETYDFDGSGKLTFEEFAEIYLMLTHYASTSANAVTLRDRLNYILNQNNPTSDFITCEQAEQVFNRINRYIHWVKSRNTTSAEFSKLATINWKSHWDKLDDGSGSYFITVQTTEAPNCSFNKSYSTVQFTFSSSFHPKWQPATNYSLPQVDVRPNHIDSCCSSLTLYFEYCAATNYGYSAPGILCLILEPCNNIINACTSSTSVCVINSCYSTQAVYVYVYSGRFLQIS